MPLSIVTWNVNSIKTRLEHLELYTRETSPDILLLQELKCTNDNFPYEAVESLGYNIAVHGQKTYNGVAILSKFPMDDVITSLPGDDTDEQARYIEAIISLDNEAIRVASVYVPNGQAPDSEKFQYKMKFFDRLHAHANTLLGYEEKLVIGGDYNVAPHTQDVFDPKSLEGTICFHPKERDKFHILTNLGLTDAFHACHPQAQQFTWWDYRGNGFGYNKGLRIDHLLLSPEAADCLAACDVHTDMRGKDKPSDHAPVRCQLLASGS